MDDSLGESREGVQVRRPRVQEAEQPWVVGCRQQKGVQHHAVGRASQARVFGGDVKCQGSQLAPLCKEVDLALPHGGIALQTKIP